MNDPRHIHISDYNYPLPDERIAKFPIAQRDHSKLLVYRHGEVSEDHFYNLPDYLPEGALMVFNNTKVIQARLHFRKATGALIEIFLLEPAEPTDYEQMFQTTGHCAWYCLIGNAKKWKDGILKLMSDDINLRAEKGFLHGTSYRVDFEWSGGLSFAELIDRIGELPIPPYLNRETQESDKTTYQTVYSKIKGSVAAPTAGLHFTPEVLSALDAHGIDREELTLHVGAGTFKPVKSEEIEGHEMHTETISVRRETIQKLINHGGQAIAVGTTSVRTLESLYYMGLKTIANPDITETGLHVSQWEPYNVQSSARPKDALTSLTSLLNWMDRHHLTVLHSSTQIIIAPGYDYKIVKALVTNFHQPQSTLLLLVSAFVHGDWRKIYDYALTHDFRFLSYGDSSLLIP
jgi:S-adenosylmethionine:tRNA ribosyltransferase-isomerase